MPGLMNTTHCASSLENLRNSRLSYCQQVARHFPVRQGFLTATLALASWRSNESHAPSVALMSLYRSACVLCRART